MKAVVIVCAFLALVAGDLYLQNPRGSNCRLNEANANRDNANRLMDTQNNAKGGYCWGPAVYFYEGSQLSIEWTSQHGCGSPKLECQVVLQYMCEQTTGGDPLLKVRDGSTTDTIPMDLAASQTLNADGEYEFGQHESYYYRLDCETRSRNLGLYVADRVTRGNLPEESAADRTRQNNNANRHGFECPEERDYFPYWHPNPWKDIAILTDNIEMCDYYKAESANVKEKGYCAPSPDANGDGLDEPAEENNPAACAQAGKQWMNQPAWGVEAPDCVKAPFQRDNHLGNGAEGQNALYNWTIPDTEECAAGDNCDCVFRIRYNVSSQVGFFADYTQNGLASPVLNNPTLDYAGNNLTYAVDTTQFARTFQDRTHVFHIRARPDGVAETNRIFNLNVRGKRGNIVQAYPSTEYDFAPETLYARVGDYVHFQWTGCDTNPAGNAGEGTAQTDRSNIVQVKSKEDSYPCSEVSHEGKESGCWPTLFETKDLRSYMAHIGQTDCLTLDELIAKNGNNEGAINADVQNCAKLNSAEPYFDGGVILLNNTGEFNYMSTRNNNFTNRGQKGTIIVEPLLPAWAVVIVIIGAVAFGGSAVVGAAMFYAKSHPHSALAEKLASFEK